MSGSGIINHPLRDEPGLKTKKNNHHSSEYSSPAAHVPQGSWGNVCVTRCMCEYSREHSRVYVQQQASSSTGKGYASSCTDFSSIIECEPKISSSNFLLFEEILGSKISSAESIRAFFS